MTCGLVRIIVGHLAGVAHGHGAVAAVEVGLQLRERLERLPLAGPGIVGHDLEVRARERRHDLLAQPPAAASARWWLLSANSSTRRAPTSSRAHELDRPRALGEIPRDRLNVNGGAIALGHPVGVSGARLLLTLLMEMRRRGLRRGMASLCVGGGQGAAFILERDA